MAPKRDIAGAAQRTAPKDISDGLLTRDGYPMTPLNLKHMHVLDAIAYAVEAPAGHASEVPEGSHIVHELILIHLEISGLVADTHV
ncbi:MAG: hypothetical protein KAV87_44090, partial [Desulfobacteraceae bacterium]|nr:hypothetical protein [Desulfobacteraceae bacterium]